MGGTASKIGFIGLGFSFMEFGKKSFKNSVKVSRYFK